MFNLRFPFRCIENCGARVNPATKMSLRGAAQSSGNKKISEYQWTIKECLKDKDECTDVSAEDKYELPVDMKQDFLIIPAGFFKGKEQERSQGSIAFLGNWVIRWPIS